MAARFFTAVIVSAAIANSFSNSTSDFRVM
jgi:hypothetical protein